MKTLFTAMVLLTILKTQDAYSQAKVTIDPSKPTNFYNSINSALEFSARGNGGNQFGLRANLVLAPSDRHLVLGELPLLYNTESKAFGLGDVRARYFFLPYKNYAKFFGAFGPSLDIIAPTGNASKGLGTGRWTIAPGIAMGLMFSEKIQVFPILSYQYMSRPVFTDDSPSAAPINGGSLQFVTVIILSPKAYLNLTPTMVQHYQNGQGTFGFTQEATIGFQLPTSAVLALYAKRDFKNDINQISVGYTKFF